MTTKEAGHFIDRSYNIISHSSQPQLYLLLCLHIASAIKVMNCHTEYIHHDNARVT